MSKLLDLFQEPTKMVEFNGGEVEIKKLPVATVLFITEMYKNKEEDADMTALNTQVLKRVLTTGVVGGEGLEPVIEGASFDMYGKLNELSNEIMNFSDLLGKDEAESS